MNGMIAWFARNQVAANLLMMVILVGGCMTVPTIKQTLMPDFEFNLISITIVYPGASPEEIEKAVTIRVEEEIQDVEGIVEIRSSANEGATNIMVELEASTDVAKVLDEIESRIDGIVTFPEEIEEPLIRELQFRIGVLDIAVHGFLDERSLKALGQQVRDEVARLPGISQVDLVATRPYELSIEVAEGALQSYGLRFDDVVDAVRRTSIDTPGGSVRTRAGEILLRTDNQGYWGPDFESVPVLTRRDGSRVSVGQVATVIDGFEENIKTTRFDGEPAVFVRVFRVGQQQALDVASKVHAYLDEARHRLPEGARLSVWDDSSVFLSDRINMMLGNALSGFVLVLLLLALFLRLRVAFWVAMGLPIAIAGALMAMPWLGIGINFLTVFAFIMALGILVDDAIVTGENIYTHQLRDKSDPLGAAIRGTQEVATPVVFGVLTTVAAFVPFALIDGDAKFMATAIGGVMCVALLFSLVESKLILPSHLAHSGGYDAEPRYAWTRQWSKIQEWVNARLETFIDRAYRPAVQHCVEWRYLTIAVSIAVFIIAIGLIAGGRVKSVMMPSTEWDYTEVRLTMPLGTPVSETEDAMVRLEFALDQLRTELEEEREPGEPEMIRHVLTMLGAHRMGGPSDRPGELGQPHLGQISLELSASEVRSVEASKIADRWRDLVGSIPGVEELTFEGRLRHFGSPIDMELRGDDTEMLQAAAAVLAHELEQFPGVFDIRDSHREGKQELKIEIRPEAEALGLSVQNVGRQVRQAFYGAEAQRIQRGPDEVKVMVRYPASERRSLADVEGLRIRLADGTAVPFASVADVSLGRGAASLARVDRERQIRVTADLDEETVNAAEIAEQLRTEVMPKIMDRFPGVYWAFQGEQKERTKAMGSIFRGFVIAGLSIFTLIAIPLRSYVQSIVIMLTIPFGYVGSIVGHLIWGYDMSFLSLIGVMACAGVVVNDTLVLVTFMNRLTEQGHSVKEAAMLAGQRRFRPILLTSATTFAGLMPVILEQSTQAEMIVPMAISLGHGVLVATIFTLLLVPAAIVAIEDVKSLTAGGLRRVLSIVEERASYSR